MQTLAITNTAQHFLQSFSWTLIHSLWQGLFFAVVTGLLLTFARRSAAAVRYNLVLLQLVLFVLACGATFIWEWNRTPHIGAGGLAAGVAHAASTLPFNLDSNSIRQFANRCISYFSANAPMVVLLWFVFFMFRTLRMMGSLVYIHRARNRSIYQPSAEWKAKVDVLCEKLRLKRAVRLLESGYVKVPMVIGHLKPVILVPVGLLAGLPPGQVEAVLLHELAHIRRYDYFVNLLQAIAETVFFFNPGLLWISSVLRDERENCCDDIALSFTRNKREFIEALISFKEHALYSTNYQVAFPGKKNHLLNRVARILNNRNKAFGTAEKAFFILGIFILSTVVVTASIAQVRGTFHPTIRQIAKSTERTLSVKTYVIDKPVAPAAKGSFYSSTVIKIDKTSASDDTNDDVTDASQVNETQDEVTRQKQESIQEQLQVKKDQEQALRDQLQAKRDQEQALRDQQQAKKDQEEAKKDQEQAKKEAEETRRVEDQERQREQAKKNDDQAKLNSDQAKRNDEQAIRNSEQAKRNQEQVERNKKQVKLNDLQSRRNEEQARRNEEQNIRNQQQANKNQVSIQE